MTRMRFTGKAENVLLIGDTVRKRFSLKEESSIKTSGIELQKGLCTAKVSMRKKWIGHLARSN
jgi:hypothetical protein